jgi:hypothetical protein
MGMAWSQRAENHRPLLRYINDCKYAEVDVVCIIKKFAALLALIALMATCPLPASSQVRHGLAALSRDERDSIESACGPAKMLDGPAAYNQCLHYRLDERSRGPRRPDLSALSRDERDSIESACGPDKILNGPAAYNHCLQYRLDEWSRAPRRPDLSVLSSDDRDSIESACGPDKILNGPAAYNQCLQHQLKSLGIQLLTRVVSPAVPSIIGTKVSLSQTNESNNTTKVSGKPRTPKAFNNSTLHDSNESLQSNPLAVEPNRYSRTDYSIPERTQPTQSSSGNWTKSFFAAFFVCLVRWLWNLGMRCPRCHAQVDTRGAFCSQCAVAIQRESEIAEERMAEAQKAFQQKQAAERASQEEHRRRMEQEAENRRQQLRTLEQLQKMTGSDFEGFITSLFRKDGYSVHQCGGSGDEGIDLVIETSAAKDVVQCKRWKSDVGSPVVREFYGSLMHAGARHGFIITTASYSQSARGFAQGKPITLISGDDIIAWSNKSFSARKNAESSERERQRANTHNSSDHAKQKSFDPFMVLGIRLGATQEEIRSAYKREMASYHPDKVAHLGQELQELAKRKTQEINHAYHDLLCRA